MTQVELALLATSLPAAAALSLAVLPALRRRGALAAALSISTVAASLLAALLLLVRQLQPGAVATERVVSWIPNLAEVGVRVDGISASMLAVVALIALCVQVFSWGYLHGEDPRAIGRYYTYQSLFIVSMALLVIAPNLLQLFIGWELVGVTSYLLIGHYFKKQSAARAALKAFWTTKLADVGLLFALLVQFAGTGGFTWTELAPGFAATVVTLCLFVAVAGKSAQFPLHVWLPDAMEGPTPVSALLHAATMVAAGVYLVVRAWPLFEATPLTGEVMAYLGAFTALFAALLAVAQRDIKKMLAYSTCSQLGYMIAALGAGSVMGGYFHLLTHAGFKALLFLVAGNVIHAVHSNDMGEMGGLWRRMKLSAFAFVLGALALAGLPGLSGAFSKELVLETVAGKGLWLPLGMLMVAVPLTAFYMARAAFKVFFGAPSPAAAHAHEAPPSMLLPVLLLTVPTALAGFGGADLAGLIGARYHFHFGALSAFATALALGGVGLAFFTRRGEGALSLLVARGIATLEAAARGAWVNKLYEFGYRTALAKVAQAAAWVDRYVIDALVNALGVATLATGRKVRVAQTGNVRDYLWVMGSAVAVLVIWGAW